MNFIILAPALGDSLWETVNFRDVLLDLAQVARLVEGLQWGVLSIKVGFTVDGASQGGTVIGQTSTRFEVQNANNLLV